MAKKNVKSAEPKKKKPISLNILEIAKRLQKLEETGGGGEPYTLPTASADTKGGVKIGSGLTMTGEVLSATGGGGSASDVSYDNTTSGLTATTVQGAIDEVAGDVAGLSANEISYGTGTVEDALNGLTDYAFGQEIDISAYTQLNPYICPSDGYVRVYVNNAGTSISYGDIKLNNLLYTRIFNPANSNSIAIACLYVKKGMRVNVDGTSGKVEGYFVPLE